MANNRMYLRHKITGKTILLAAHHGLQWSLWNIEKNNNNIHDFFDDHLVEDQHADNNYEIVYE